MKNFRLIIAAFLAMGSVAAFGQVAPPYIQGFSATDDFNKMTLIDANSDNNTWTRASYDPISYSPAARYTGSTDNGADDWIITEALALKAGYVYEFSFYAIGAAAYTNNLDVMIGTEPAAEALTKQVTETIVLTERAKNSYSAEIEVESDGTYYVGIHLTAEANQGAVYIDDIKIAGGIIANAPAAVSSISATPAVSEAKAVVNLSLVMPSVTNSGAELPSISNVAIYRDADKIADLGEQSPGATVNYTDNAPVVGYSTYKVVCSNDAGDGAEASVSARVSFSAPVAPANVAVATTETGQRITWDAVSVAAGTGLFIPENVTYTVTRSDKVEIASGLTECAIDDTYAKEGEGQDLISYTVTANNEAGASAAGTSNSILVGNPYTGEYAESFAGSKYSTSTWQNVGGTSAMWATTPSTYYSPAISSPQDADGGFAKFYTYTKGATQRLVSPIINVSDMQNPRLSFYMYQTPDCSYGEKLIPEILVDGIYTPLHDGITVAGETAGWVKFNFDLDKELVSKNFQLSFQGVADGGYNVAIDNITITDALAYNVAVTSVSAPVAMTIGKESNISANIKNTGINETSGYSVNLYLDGEKIKTIEGPQLVSDASVDVVFGFTPLPYQSETALEFSVDVEYAEDLNASDNSASISVDVLGSTLPTPTELSAANGTSSIVLDWTAPVVPEVEVKPVGTESFEDWEANSMVAFADWKFVDNDGLNSYGFGGVNRSVPLAFMTAAYSASKTGANVLVSPKNYSWRDYRDDWAISPEVVGGQTVTFSVCQYNGYGYSGTMFYFCYSTSDNNIESFVALGDVVYDKSSSWTEYSFTLPENAKYFAIHVVDDGSSTSDALLIDDITFQPGSVQLVHTGYNVYRDNSLLATIADPAQVAYDDRDIKKDREYEYAVSALYETGESELSNVATLLCTVGIESVAESSASLFISDRAVIANGYVGQILNVYTTDGKVVLQKTILDDKASIELAPGSYIISIGDDALKAIIR